MSPFSESAALIALLRTGARPWRKYAELVEDAGSALAVLEHEQGRIDASPRLFEPDDDFRLDSAAAEVAGWEAQGIRVLTVLDAEYPDNLRAVYDRPPLIFVAGSLQARDDRSVAVIGSRDATRHGTWFARQIAELAAGGRTVAVIGTGLTRSYPPQNAALQRRIGQESAVVSQFWPDAAPSRRSFPTRNALMSGLSLATVIVEASPTSGARTQARFALAHGRPVLLIEWLLQPAWGRELSSRPGVHVVSSAVQVVATVQRLSGTEALVV